MSSAVTTAGRCHGRTASPAAPGRRTSGTGPSGSGARGCATDSLGPRVRFGSRPRLWGSARLLGGGLHRRYAVSVITVCPSTVPGWWLAHQPTHDGLVRLAFDETRRADDQPAVCLYLLEVPVPGGPVGRRCRAPGASTVGPWGRPGYEPAGLGRHVSRTDRQGAPTVGGRLPHPLAGGPDDADQTAPLVDDGRTVGVLGAHPYWSWTGQLRRQYGTGADGTRQRATPSPHDMLQIAKGAQGLRALGDRPSGRA